MSEINWERLGRATYAQIRYFDKDGNILDFQKVDRPQQKTVADAYEALNGNWDAELNFLYWHTFRGWVYAADGDNDGNYSLVCTREQFEAYAKEQEAKKEGEKWTHTLRGKKCFIKIKKPDFDGYILVDTEARGYQLCKLEDLKPIKSKLTEDAMKAVERFAYSLMDKESYDLVSEVNSFRDAHEII